MVEFGGGASIADGSRHRLRTVTASSTTAAANSNTMPASIQSVLAAVTPTAPVAVGPGVSSGFWDTRAAGPPAAGPAPSLMNSGPAEAGPDAPADRRC